MNRNLSIGRSFVSFGVPLALFALLIILIKSTFLKDNSILSFAVTVDLLIMVPIVYFLLIRKTDIPKTTVIPVMMVGLLIGSWMLPVGSQSYLRIFKTWVLSGLSVYTAIQILGFARSLSRRPVVITNSSLILRYGILNEVEIALADLAKVELSNKLPDQDGLTTMLSPLSSLESHNVIISLKKENDLIGIYGIKKRFKVIGIHIDEPERFKEEAEKAMTRLQ